MIPHWFPRFDHWDAHACKPCVAMSGDDQKMVHSHLRNARTRYAVCRSHFHCSLVVGRLSLIASRAAIYHPLAIVIFHGIGL